MSKYFLRKVCLDAPPPVVADSFPHVFPEHLREDVLQALEEALFKQFFLCSFCTVEQHSSYGAAVTSMLSQCHWGR